MKKKVKARVTCTAIATVIINEDINGNQSLEEVEDIEELDDIDDFKVIYEIN